MFDAEESLIFAICSSTFSLRGTTLLLLSSSIWFRRLGGARDGRRGTFVSNTISRIQDSGKPATGATIVRALTGRFPRSPERIGSLRRRSGSGVRS